MIQPSTTWRQGWTDVLFGLALLCAAVAHLLAPLTFMAFRIPGILPPGAGERLSHMLGLADRGQLLVLFVGAVGIAAAVAYALNRRKGLAASSLFALWTFFLGTGLAPLTWALLAAGF